MSKSSLRVHFVRHETGHFTGVLLRTWDWFFEKPAPSGFGSTEDDVLRQIEAGLALVVASEDDSLERYLWDETFELRTLAVDIYPQSAVKKRLVIGKRTIPLRITYLVSKVEGGHRVLVPRFGFRFIVEDTSVARDTLKQMVSAALLGENPSSIYDFRLAGDEYVRAWSPKMLATRASADEEDDLEDYPETKKVADELVGLAARGKVPIMLGASPEMLLATPLLERDPPASLLLVGPPGVGKTAFVQRLARELLVKKRAKKPRVPRLFSTSVERMLAGMIYLGMWQQRGLAIARELSGEGELFHVGPLLPFLRAQTDGSSLAELFFPALRAGEVSLIAECTEDELERAERRAASFVGCFQVIRIKEPPVASIPAFIAEMETRRDATVVLHPSAKKRLVQHLAMFRRDLAFPGKAVRFLDWLYQDGARQRPLDRSGEPVKGRALNARELSEAYARYSGLPVEIVADEIPASAALLSKRLELRIVGQSHACGVAAKVLARFKAGLNDPEKPVGNLLFVGPTGVGKTELAKELARTLFGDADKMIRLDMSEYLSAGSSYRLLEVGPGVTSLAQRVRNEPLSLVLLDEIEKAHPEVFDLLLGVLGEGRLTDSEGRFVDFRTTLIVMTSNLGVPDGPPLGFGADASSQPAAERLVRQHFRPELFNRIDHVVPFRALDPDDVRAIVGLELAQVRARKGFERRRIEIEVEPSGRALLARLGYHPTRGARPLRRVIEELLVAPLASRMAADPSFADARVVFSAARDDLEMRVAAEPVKLG